MWLDNVLAIPVIGIHFRASFSRVFSSAEAIGTFADTIRDSDGSATITWENPGRLAIQSPRGFVYTHRPDELILTFTYPAKSERKPGELQSKEIVESSTYSKLVEDMQARFMSFHTALLKTEFSLDRIGIMANTQLAKDARPPGLTDLIGILGKLWTMPLIKTDTTLLSVLAKKGDQTDRCHHTVKFDDGVNNGETVFNLDWQRVYEPGQRFDTKSLNKTLFECKATALDYFEAFGSGKFTYGR